MLMFKTSNVSYNYDRNVLQVRGEMRHSRYICFLILAFIISVIFPSLMEIIGLKQLRVVTPKKEVTQKVSLLQEWFQYFQDNQST